MDDILSENIFCLYLFEYYGQKDILKNILFLGIDILEVEFKLNPRLLYLEYNYKDVNIIKNMFSENNDPGDLKYLVMNYKGDYMNNQIININFPESLQFICFGNYIFDIKKLPKNIKVVITASRNKKFLKNLKEAGKIKGFRVRILYNKQKIPSLERVCKNSYKLKSITPQTIEKEIQKMFLF